MSRKEEIIHITVEINEIENTKKKKKKETKCLFFEKISKRGKAVARVTKCQERTQTTRTGRGRRDAGKNVSEMESILREHA